jgi:hypothetical protein
MIESLHPIAFVVHNVLNLNCQNIVCFKQNLINLVEVVDPILTNGMFNHYDNLTLSSLNCQNGWRFYNTTYFILQQVLLQKQLHKPIKAFLEISLTSIPMKGKFLGEY